MKCSCESRYIIKCLNIFIVIISIAILIASIIILSDVNKEKDILTAIAVKGDNTQLGTTTIKFSRNDIVIGNALTHEEGSDIILVNDTGVYQISYQLFGIKQGTGSFNFNAVLLVNDATVDSTFNDGPVLKDVINNRITLTSTVILKLNAGDTLKLAGISIEDVEYEKARIDIEKID